MPCLLRAFAVFLHGAGVGVFPVREVAVVVDLRQHLLPVLHNLGFSLISGDLVVKLLQLGLFQLVDEVLLVLLLFQILAVSFLRLLALFAKFRFQLGVLLLRCRHYFCLRSDLFVDLLHLLVRRFGHRGSVFVEGGPQVVFVFGGLGVVFIPLQHIFPDVVVAAGLQLFQGRLLVQQGGVSVFGLVVALSGFGQKLIVLLLCNGHPVGLQLDLLRHHFGPLCQQLLIGHAVFALQLPQGRLFREGILQILVGLQLFGVLLGQGLCRSLPLGRRSGFLLGFSAGSVCSGCYGILRFLVVIVQKSKVGHAAARVFGNKVFGFLVNIGGVPLCPKSTQNTMPCICDSSFRFPQSLHGPGFCIFCHLIPGIPHLLGFLFVHHAKRNALGNVFGVTFTQLARAVDLPVPRKYVSDALRQPQHGILNRRQCPGVLQSFGQAQHQITAIFSHHGRGRVDACLIPAGLVHVIGQIRHGIFGCSRVIFYTLDSAAHQMLTNFLSGFFYAVILAHLAFLAKDEAQQATALWQILVQPVLELPLQGVLGKPVVDLVPQPLQSSLDAAVPGVSAIPCPTDQVYCRLDQDGCQHKERFRERLCTGHDHVTDHGHHADEGLRDVWCRVDNGRAHGSRKEREHAKNGHDSGQLQSAAAKVVKGFCHHLKALGQRCKVTYSGCHGTHDANGPTKAREGSSYLAQCHPVKAMDG